MIDTITVGYYVVAVLGILAAGLAIYELPARFKASAARAAEMEAWEAAKKKRGSVEKEGTMDAKSSSGMTLREAAYAAFLILTIWALGISLVYLNSWLMADVFPYAATLTMVQMIFGSCMAAVLIYGPKPFVDPPTGLTMDVWATRFLPVGALYAGYLWGSNAVYDYLEVGFVQMLKPSSGLFTWALLLYTGMETFTGPKALNIIVIYVALSFVSLGQNAIGDFSLIGVFMILGAQFAQALYGVAVQQVLQAATGAMKGLRLNPLTTMLCVGPAAAFWLALVATAIEWTQPGFAWTIPWWILLIDCLLALAFNLVTFAIIQTFSALSNNLIGCAKDVIVVFLSLIIDSEKISDLEWCGYAVAIVGQLEWAHRNLDAKAVAEHASRQRENAANNADVEKASTAAASASALPAPISALRSASGYGATSA